MGVMLFASLSTALVAASASATIHSFDGSRIIAYWAKFSPIVLGRRFPGEHSCHNRVDTLMP